MLARLRRFFRRWCEAIATPWFAPLDARRRRIDLDGDPWVKDRAAIARNFAAVEQDVARAVETSGKSA